MIIKVLTYNLHKGFSALNLKYNLFDIKLALQSTGADIVFLQEVTGFIPEKLNLPVTSMPFEVLAENIWPHHSYGKNAVYKKGNHGNAILSSYAMQTKNNLDLSLHQLEKRGLLHTEVTISNKKIHLYCTHLNLTHRHRLKQVKEIIKYIKTTSNEDDPLILCGDFNDWNQKLSTYLEQELNLQEAYKSLNGLYAKTFPAIFPVVPLDRIYSRGFEALSAKPLKSKHWKVLSDHIPILSTLRLKA